MGFKRLEPTAHPPRLWGLFGAAGCGKSTFAARMKSPMLVIDADHRYQEVLPLVHGDVFQLSDQPEDNTDPERIAALIAANMRGSGVRTVIVDSLSAIVVPRVTAAVVANDAGKNKNRISAFRDKALAVRTLQDALTSTGCDVLWIWHTFAARNEKAEELLRSSLPPTEVVRLSRSLNVTMRILVDGGRRRVVVDWCRRGRTGVELVDDSGSWVGMPEKLERAMYDGLSPAEQDQLERALPTTFAGPEQAIAWGMEMGVFKDAVHAGNAYAKLKAERRPANADEMWSAWIADVVARRDGGK